MPGHSIASGFGHAPAAQELAARSLVDSATQRCNSATPPRPSPRITSSPFLRGCRHRGAIGSRHGAVALFPLVFAPQLDRERQRAPFAWRRGLGACVRLEADRSEIAGSCTFASPEIKRGYGPRVPAPQGRARTRCDRVAGMLDPARTASSSAAPRCSLRLRATRSTGSPSSRRSRRRAARHRALSGRLRGAPDCAQTRSPAGFGRQLSRCACRVSAHSTLPAGGRASPLPQRGAGPARPHSAKS